MDPAGHIQEETKQWLSDFVDFRWRKLQLKLPKKSVELLRDREALKRVKAIVDPRVSSKQQRTEGYSIENQTMTGLQWVSHMGLGEGEYIVIVGESHESASGPLETRPYLNLILDLIDEVKPKYWRVSDFDRLTRNEVVWSLNIKPVCVENGTRIIVGYQEYDLEQETSELNANLMAAFAKFANRQRVRLSKEGRLAAASRGRWLTWSAPFGYRKVEEGPRKGYLEINEDERKVYELVVRWVFEKKGLNRIARELNLLGIPTKCSKDRQRFKLGKGPFKWQYGTVWHILRNPLYKGEYWYMDQKTLVPALISPEQWQALQVELDSRVNCRGLRASKRFYLLQGLLVCRRCGRRLFGKVKVSQRCGNWDCEKRLTALIKAEKYGGGCPSCGSPKVRKEQERAYCCLSKKPDPDYRSCGLRSVNMDEAERVVWDLVSELTRNSERLRRLIQSQLEPQEVDLALVSFELEAIDKEVQARDRQIDALLRSQEVLENPQYVKRTIENLHKEKEELLINKYRLQAEQARQELQRQRVDWIERAWKKIGERLDQMTDQERFDFLHAFLLQVRVDYDEKTKTHLFEPVVAIELDDSVPLPESLQEHIVSV